MASLGSPSTPWCIAPEQWRGRPCPASDVYALGCVLYDLTTGHPPFDGSLTELMTAHLEHRPTRPSWVRPMPIALERLIRLPQPLAEVLPPLVTFAPTPERGPFTLPVDRVRQYIGASSASSACRARTRRTR